MPNSQITFVYTVRVFGTVAPATLLASLSAVPLDYSLLRLWGLLPQTDVSAQVNSTTLTRTIACVMGTSFSSTGGFTLEGGTGRILNYTITGGGYPTNLGRPAVPIISDLTGPGKSGLLTLGYGIGSVAILNQGSGYTGATTLTPTRGGVFAAGAVLTPIIVGGKITGVTITAKGSGFTQFPEIVATDPGGGSGALIVGGLTPVSATIQNPGSGYQQPSLAITPHFKVSAPDTSNQVGTVKGWLTQVLARALAAPVVEQVTVS